MTAEGQCRSDDRTLMVDGDTDVIIENVSMTKISDERVGVGTALEDADMEFSGSFTVEFEDRVDALRFWAWLHGSPRPTIDDAAEGQRQ